MGGRRTWEFIAVVIAVTCQFLTATLISAQTTRSASTQPTERQLHLKFVDAVTGKPVAGVTGTYWPDRQTEQNVRQYTSDSQGECVFTFDAGAKSVEFFYHIDGYVESLMTFGGEFGAQDIPQTYTLRLQPGITVGGVVQDESAKGISGATVNLNFNVDAPDRVGGAMSTYGQAKTDDQGKWVFKGAPANPTSTDLYARHPDFIADRNRGDRPDFDVLRRQSLVTRLRRGVAMTGTVVDGAGMPVGGARVQANGVTAVASDKDGEFRLPGVAPGRAKLVVIAQGFAIQAVEVDAAEGATPLNVRLEPGHLLRGRVVDAKGRAVPDTYVSVQKWRTENFVTGFKTDAEGRFEWKSAPPDGVMLMVNGMDPGRKPIAAKADGPEVTLTVPPRLVARGHVVDDSTGKPVERFTIHLSAEQARGGWSAERVGRNGEYNITMSDDANSYRVRVFADGYMPLDSPRMRSEEGVVVFDARLNHGGGVVGTVFQPDGKPANDAELFLWDRVIPTFENGVIRGRWDVVPAKSDPSGRFELPPRADQYKLIVIHDSGWTDLTLTDSKALQNIKLRAWCTITGKLVLGGKPRAHETIWIRPSAMASTDGVHRTIFQYRTTTDAQGRFTLSRVIDGPTVVSVMRIVEMGDGRNSYVEDHGVPLQLEPGQTISDLQIGGTGRPVIAHLIIADDLKSRGLIPAEGSLDLSPPQPGFVPPPTWDSLGPDEKKQLRQAYEATDEFQRYARKVKEFRSTIAPDGTMRFEDVPSGRYVLNVDVQRPSPEDEHMWRRIAAARLEITVPDGDVNQPIDVGSLILGKVDRPDPGAPAPQAEFTTYDGKRIKLADFRGKFVLLDFWATWCGPCIAEFPHVERLHKEFSPDPRLVILGVSVDDQPAAPDKYLQARKLPWQQAFAGPTAWTSFGISAIPSFWLISPEGKIIAKEISPDALDKVLHDAMTTNGSK